MKLCNVIRADGGVRREGVLFQLIVAEVVLDEGFGFDVARAAGPARADGDKLAGVVEGALAVELGKALRARRRRP